MRHRSANAAVFGRLGTHFEEAKKGWRIADLGASVESAFRFGDRTMRWEIRDGESKDVVTVLYYTPVRKSLRESGQKLGGYLHAAKRAYDRAAQTRLRSMLSEIAEHLSVANTGTLLGPALVTGKSQVIMNVEVLPEAGPNFMTTKAGAIGRNVIINVSYLEHLPKPIEPTAYVWKP